MYFSLYTKTEQIPAPNNNPEFTFKRSELLPSRVLQVGQQCTYGFSHTPSEGEYLALISTEHLANVSVALCAAFLFT